MFIAEISPVKQRGQLVLLNQFFVLTAIFMAFVVFKRIQAENPENEVAIVKKSVEQELKLGHGKLFVRENRYPIIFAILIAAFNQLAGTICKSLSSWTSLMIRFMLG